MFSFFQILLVLLSLLKIIKVHSLCQYTDCFNCSVCGTEQNCDCDWSHFGNECKKSQPKNIIDYNYDYFDKCNDELSLEIQNKYCGNSYIEIDDNNSTYINLKENNGKYGEQNLYCEYIYSQILNPSSPTYNILSTISHSVKSYLKLHIIVTHNNNTFENLKITEEKFEKSYKNVKKIKIQVFCARKLSVNPFLIEISIKETKKNYSLIISVGIIVFFFIICGVIIFLVSRKAAQNARRRQEIFIQIARTNRRYEDGTSSSEYTDPSSSSESQVNIQEKNKKIIEKLLKTTLAPKKYTLLGIHDGNPSVVCTICLEEIKVDISKVSITPCKHVFHFDCLSNWLTNNLLNPKCPNCNLNLVQEKNECICSQGLYDIPVLECNIMRSYQSRILNINRRIINIEATSGNNMGSVALDTAENRLMTKNDNSRGRDKNNIVKSVSINNLCTSKDDNNAKSQNTANSGNIKKEEEVIVIESINNTEN